MSAEEEPLELSSNEDDLDLSSDTEQESDNERNRKSLRLNRLMNPKLKLKQHQVHDIVNISIIEEVTMEEMEPKQNLIPTLEPETEPVAEPRPEPEIGTVSTQVNNTIKPIGSMVINQTNQNNDDIKLPQKKQKKI